jgi:WD40 repeat protein
MPDPIERTEVAADRRETAPATRVGGPAPAYYFLAPPQQPDEIGRLGSYRVLRELGRGGMGVVFLAEDSVLRRPVALKVLKGDLAADAASRQRFLREARLAAAIEHDHIVPVYQIGEDRGVIFLAMPLLRGETLADRLRREKSLPLPEVLRIGREVAAGLAAAHERGLIHRDVKPANLFLEAGSGRVKILDFGLARREAPAGNYDTAPLTQEGAIVGTPGFMAPEQARGGKVDHRCDLFSLGCVLYTLACGELPFKGTDMIAMLLAVTTEQPRPPRECNPALPPVLSDLVLRMLAKDPVERPQSAAEVVAALRAMDRPGPPTEPLHATAILPAPPRRRAGRGRGLARALLVGVGLLLLVGVWVGVYHWTTRPGPEPPPAGPTPSPLDKLDAGQVPAADRFDWQPKELVAVLGEHHARQWYPIREVVFSPDGTRLASCGSTVIHLWDANTLNEVDVLRGHQRTVHRVVFAPNGKFLASSGADATVRLWDVSEGKARPLKVFTGPGEANEPAFSPDSKRLAFAGASGTVRLYDLARQQEEELTTREGKHTANADVVAFAPDGSTLVSHEANGTVLVHDLSVPPGKRPPVRLRNPTGRPLFVAPATLACANKDGEVWLCDLRKKDRPEELAKTKAHKGNVVRLAGSASAQVLASAEADGKVQMWGVAQGADGPRLEARGIPFAAHAESLQSLALASDGQALAVVGGMRRTVWLWSLVRGRLDRRIDLSAGSFGVQSVTFAPSSKALVTGGEDRIVRVWDLAGKTAVERTPIKGHAYWVSSLAFAHDSKTLASGGHDNAIRLWDLSTGAPKERVLPHDATVVESVYLAYTSSGKLCSSHPWGSARLWDLSGDGSNPTLLPGTLRNPSALAVARGGGRLAVADKWRENGREVGRVQVWDLTGEQPSEPKALPGVSRASEALALSDDGSRLVCGGADGALRLWDLTGPEPKQLAQDLGHAQVVWSAVLTPDGRMLVSGSEDLRVKVWDLAGDQFEERRALEGHTMPPRALALTADGKRIASSDRSGRVIVWDGASGEKLREWQMAGPVWCLAFAEDGRHLALGNGNGTAYVLRLPAAE